MKKFMLALRFRSHFYPSMSRNCRYDPNKPFISFITSLSTLSLKGYSSTFHLSPTNSILSDYLIDFLKFPKARALEISSRFRNAKLLENPKTVIHFLRALGLSDPQIQSTVHNLPRILFTNVDKTLKPKVTYFQELGLSENHLGALLSKHSCIFNLSLDRSLKPGICLIIEILRNDGNNRSNQKVVDDVFRVLTRNNRIVHMKSTFESNVSYFKSYGIVGSQLAFLLLRQTRIFCSPTEKVVQVVSRAVDMGFVMGSRKFVHAVITYSQVTTENINKKYDMIQSFGFSRNEVTEMFLKSPSLPRFSEITIRHKIRFFLHNLMFNKSVLVSWPVCLALSLEKRVIPRYRVMEVIKSRRLLKRVPHISDVLSATNEKFVEAYISRFGDDAGDLMLAYEGRLLESSKE